jgi:hypothetical protein
MAAVPKQTRAGHGAYEAQTTSARAGHSPDEIHSVNARAGQGSDETQNQYARAGYDAAALIALVAMWEDTQQQRKRDGNRLGALLAHGGQGEALDVLTEHVEREVKNEKTLSVAIQRETGKHPMYPFRLGIPGLGAHNFGIVLALLEGDPYIAFPKTWVEGKGKRVDGHQKKRELVRLDPRVRTVSQLWSYASLNPERPQRREGMSQEEHLARGKAYLGARVRLAVEGVLKMMCGVCHDDVDARASRNENGDKVYAPWAPPPPECTCAKDGFVYRALFNEKRLRYEDAVHERPCRGKGTCGLDVGTPWRPGHKRQAAVNIVAKQLLADMYDEAKRLHLAGEWDA